MLVVKYIQKNIWNIQSVLLWAQASIDGLVCPKRLAASQELVFKQQVVLGLVV